MEQTLPVFLNARWEDLVMINYEIDPEVLKPYVPFGTEPDLWNGHCYASLVGFMFRDTRVRGFRVPFHVNFEEVNLRFYVKRKEGDTWKRAVVFIREIVPSYAICWVANNLYYENYRPAKMEHFLRLNDHRSVGYSWKMAGNWNEISVKAAREALPIADGSHEEFITEHYWGYVKAGAERTFSYQVEHPRWLVHTVEDFLVDIDIAQVYGKHFVPFFREKPQSAFLAQGSEIIVRKGYPIV